MMAIAGSLREVAAMAGIETLPVFAHMLAWNQSETFALEDGRTVVISRSYTDWSIEYESVTAEPATIETTNGRAVVSFATDSAREIAREWWNAWNARGVPMYGRFQKDATFFDGDYWARHMVAHIIERTQ